MPNESETDEFWTSGLELIRSLLDKFVPLPENNIFVNIK
jgi:hypothetical protein